MKWRQRLSWIVFALSAVACRSDGRNSQRAAPSGSTKTAALTPAAPRSSGALPPAPVPSGPGFHVFLLLGQSNMWGVPKPEPVDREVHARVKVLAFEDCPELGRKHDEWYPAAPPLHACDAGVGPGDTFGKTYANARPDVTVGLVPLAIGGASIALFRKGVAADNRREFRIPPDDHWAGGYEWILARARVAQRSGVIRGILLHQGESDAHFNRDWENHVAGLVADLRADLALGTGVPFVAGELRRSGCCAPFNLQVQRIPALVPNAAVASSEGLTGADEWHFDLPSQRLLGERYAKAILARPSTEAPASP